MAELRRIAIATFSRAEYASSLALLRAAAGRHDLEPLLMVGGSHLDPRQGNSLEFIHSDGFQIAARVPFLVAGDDARSAVASLAAATSAIGESLEELDPEVLVLSGDRYELLAAAGAALLLRIPVAHIAGGELTEGAFDEQVRHAVTKLSHLHFVAMEEFRQRLLRMGEEPWRVIVSGDPALDVVVHRAPADRAEVARQLGVPAEQAWMVVAYHPATLEAMGIQEQVEALLAGCSRWQGAIVLTGANADPGGASINRRFQDFAAPRPGAVFRPHLGERLFHGLLDCSELMVGNSSAGIWEAPSFGLPVVNVGERQRGRARARNVVDVPLKAEAIASAIQKCRAPEFRSSLEGMENPYGDGAAARRILDALAAAGPREKLLVKRFFG